MANEISAGMVQPYGVREVNTETILGLLRRDRHSTRTALMRQSGLSKATVSLIVADLLEQGFAIPVGKEQGGRGRSRVLLRFNPMARSVLGAQVADDVCTLVITDLDGRAYRRLSKRFSGSEPAAVLDALTDGATMLRESAESPVLGFGLGVPGMVDRSGRHITMAVSQGWHDVPVADILEERLELPVVVANRAKVAALGQLGESPTTLPIDLIYVFLGSGVIAGLVIDGQLYNGRDGGAGDIGHVTVQPDGVLCDCGNRGCLHTIADEKAILALARSKARKAGAGTLLQTLTGGRLGELSLAVVAEAASNGDPAAEATISEVGMWLGIVIANLVNTFNPDQVIIGGPTTCLGEALMGPIRHEVHTRALTEASHGLKITMSTADDESAAVGAAVLWISRALAARTSLPLPGYGLFQSRNGQI